MKKLYRNYTCDYPKMYRDIHIAVCEAFDELQKDSDGVEYKDMLSHIMNKSKGHWNPAIVQDILKQFEK